MPALPWPGLSPPYTDVPAMLEVGADDKSLMVYLVMSLRMEKSEQDEIRTE